MPNWEELANQMTVPFGEVRALNPQPVQPRPDMNALAQQFPGQLSTGQSTATFSPMQMYGAWPESPFKALVGGLLGLAKAQDTRTPQEKAVSMALDAGGMTGGLMLGKGALKAPLGKVGEYGKDIGRSIDWVGKERPGLTGLSKRYSEFGGSEGRVVEDLFRTDPDREYRIANEFNLNTVTPKMADKAAKEMRDFTQWRLQNIRKLPEEVTVYRAGKIDDEVVGVTLNKSTAKFHSEKTGHPVQEYKIPRDAILADIEGIKPYGYQEGELLVYGKTLMQPKSGLSLAEAAPDLMSTIRSLQPQGQGRALVSISELREKSGMSPKEFDAQLLQLAREGKVALHQHDFASSLKPEQRAKLLAVDNPNAYWGGKDFYVGVVPK